MSKLLVVFLFGLFITMMSFSQATFVSEATTDAQSLRITLDSPAAADNAVNGPSKVSLYVILPQDYYTSNQKYPVVYYLHGFSSMNAEVKNYLPQINLGFKDKNKFIIVGIDGRGKFFGSFYVNSATTGRWEDWVVKEAVSYVDGRFRTLAKPESRGLLGISMGGFGVLYNALRHPDVFSAAYAVVPGVFEPENGLKEAMVSWSNDLSFKRAYGGAFAGSLTDFPAFSGTPEDNALIEKWNSGFGGWDKKVDDYLKQPKRLKALAIEWGTADYYKWIPKGSEWLAGYLQSRNIPVQAEKTTGGHDLYTYRMLNTVIPFFQKNLEYK